MLEHVFQCPGDAELVPQVVEGPRPSHGAAGEEAQPARGLLLQLEGVCGVEEATDAFDEALEGLNVKLVGTTEGVEDVSFRDTGFGVANVVGQLDIGDDGTVFVLRCVPDFAQRLSNSGFRRMWSGAFCNPSACETRPPTPRPWSGFPPYTPVHQRGCPHRPGRSRPWMGGVGALR